MTIINYYGESASKCGYCKGIDCGISHGMHAYSMLPQDYQDLIDRGWRRSGCYCYKPQNKVTCCPCYTIKCDALEFKLTKSHKKILKRMNRFLRDGKKDKSEEDAIGNAAAAAASGGGNDDGDDDCGVDGGGLCEEPQAPQMLMPEINVEAVHESNAERLRLNDPAEKNVTDCDEQPKPSNALQIETNAVTAGASGSQSSSKKSFDGLNPTCKKAKQMRLERREAKLAAKGATSNNSTATTTAKTTASKEKSLKDFFTEAKLSDKHQLKIDFVPVKSKHFDLTLSSTFKLYQKYQLHIHRDPPEDVNEYLNFLQRSPLKLTKAVGGPAIGYGSFHQQYWLDEKLIAVGVIDILPHCVSSVYFFYDPDYSFLSLGTYGSLREIAFVQELAEIVPALKYYYMGFYIHSCPKMRYKGKLVPSYLLCPETYTWNLLTDETRTKLNENKYQRLNADPNAKDANNFLECNLDLVLLLVDRSTCITYRQFIQSFNIETLDNMLDVIRSRIYKEITGESDDRESILEYGRLVGKSCAHRMLYLKT